MKKTLKNPHPGKLLKEEFLNDLNISQRALARSICVPPSRVNDIVRGYKNITADTDLRLCKFFGLTEGYFLRLQIRYDTLEAKRNLGKKLSQITTYKQT